MREDEIIPGIDASNVFGGDVPPRLDELALKHGTDKSSAHHNYTPIYDDLFWLHRYDKFTMLELGVFRGESVRMWAEYFPNATIVGVDNDLSQFVWTPVPRNLQLLESDQADPHLAALEPLNIIIDDASHLSSLTIKSFELLYPILAPGGIYVVEDTHSSYHAWYYGAPDACPDPDGPTMYGDPTAMQYLKRLADEVNFDPSVTDRKGGGLFPAKYWKGFRLKSISFYHDLCIIQKAGKWSSSTS